MNKDVRIKVVMLPTTELVENGDCLILKSGVELRKCITGAEYRRLVQYFGCVTQHLYFVSNEEIQGGDWFIDDSNQLKKAVVNDIEYWKRRPDYLKVIETTNTSIGTHDYHNNFIPYPKPSDKFIRIYIEEFNKGNIIEKFEDITEVYMFEHNNETSNLQKVAQIRRESEPTKHLYTEVDMRNAYINGATDYSRSSYGLKTFLEKEVDILFNQKIKSHE